jgi:hypothetical protein
MEFIFQENARNSKLISNVKHPCLRPAKRDFAQTLNRGGTGQAGKCQMKFKAQVTNHTEFSVFGNLSLI